MINQTRICNLRLLNRMKTFLNMLIIIAALLGSVQCFAKCKSVYTIGAYDEAFKSHLTVTKLGPLAASEVPPALPKSFLEKDGSYGGGEAFCTRKKACITLIHQLDTGKLPDTENWHIYILDADWNRDTYKLHANDFRINHAVTVLKLVREKC